ncbi:unnamed protein product [Ilex paraguariensis]|uniref:F-box domain-containing protein n=1 Tax=Ilex paraguariensis TaxID=185542 RepID=A0ABC8TN47_9AQUA
MLDRLGDMPWDILDNILGCLPIKDAVRTSVLSRKWRYTWVYLSNIVFYDRCKVSIFEWPVSIFGHWNELAKFVYNVLLAHRGRIDKFMLSTRLYCHDNDADLWSAFLSRNGIKELSLNLCYMAKYELPSCLFSCQQLSCLCIAECSVVTPHTFNGFNNLVSLQLEVGRPYYGAFGSLHIYAPNLQSLDMSGKFMTVYLENSLHLTQLSFLMDPNWYMAHDKVPLLGFGFPVAFDNLKALELSEVCFNELDEISVFLSLLERSFSNLKSLCISAFGPFNQDVYKLMAAQNQLSYCFNQLQIVKINIALCHQYVGAFQCWRSDLEFIKLVLARSPVLEKMLVGYNYPEDCDLWFMRKLLSFERASSQLVFKYSSSPNPELYTVSSFLYDW